MSLSKECQEYHLTLKGWVHGSFQSDPLGSSEEVQIPTDRVLTIACYDELPSAFSKPHYYDRIVWQSSDEKLIRELQTKWGERPPWFGYNK